MTGKTSVQLEWLGTSVAKASRAVNKLEEVLDVV